MGESFSQIKILSVSIQNLILTFIIIINDTQDSDLSQTRIQKYICNSEAPNLINDTTKLHTDNSQG